MLRNWLLHIRLHQFDSGYQFFKLAADPVTQRHALIVAGLANSLINELLGYAGTNFCTSPLLDKMQHHIDRSGLGSHSWHCQSLWGAKRVIAGSMKRILAELNHVSQSREGRLSLFYCHAELVCSV